MWFSADELSLFGKGVLWCGSRAYHSTTVTVSLGLFGVGVRIDRVDRHPTLLFGFFANSGEIFSCLGWVVASIGSVAASLQRFVFFAKKSKILNYLYQQRSHWAGQASDTCP